MWTHWRSYFETHARRPMPTRPSDTDAIPVGWRAPLCASLARFQLGEGGEGRIAGEIRRAGLPGTDADYHAALGLFVKEEGRHARILAGMVRALGGELLRRHWTERLFVVGRRLLGLRLKLLVLLVAEVLGLGFYALLSRALGSGAIAEQLREIADDEGMHLEFHADFFRAQVGDRTAARWVFRAAWWSVALLACVVLVLDHRRTLRALGVPIYAAIGRLLRLVALVDRRVLGAPIRTLVAWRRREAA
jgi:hypothetical protein